MEIRFFIIILFIGGDVISQQVLKHWYSEKEQSHLTIDADINSIQGGYPKQIECRDTIINNESYKVITIYDESYSISYGDSISCDGYVYTLKKCGRQFEIIDLVTHHLNNGYCIYIIPKHIKYLALKSIMYKVVILKKGSSKKKRDAKEL